MLRNVQALEQVSGLVAREGSCQKAWAVPSVSNTRLVGPNDGQDCPLYEAKDGDNNGDV